MTSSFLQAMNQAAEAWWPYVLHATWTSSLVAVVLLGIVRLHRRWPARVRHAILLIALVKFLLPPTLALPVGVFHWFGPSVAAQESSSDGDSAEAASMGGRVRMSWKGWLFLLHAWGSLITAGAIGWQLVRVRRLLRGSHEVNDGPVYERLMRLSRQIGLRRPVRLLVSSCPIAPMAMGLFRPSVLVPVSVHNRLPAEEVETVLAHELAHHRRGDLWLNWLQITLRVAWWFNPLLRVLNRAIRQAGEDCCDDFLLARRVATGEGYCRALLRVARELGRQPRMEGALGFAEAVHPLGLRMQRIMDPQLQRPMRFPMMAFAPLALLAILVLPGLPTEAGGIRPTPGGGAMNAALATLDDPNSEPTPETATSPSQTPIPSAAPAIRLAVLTSSGRQAAPKGPASPKPAKASSSQATWAEEPDLPSPALRLAGVVENIGPLEAPEEVPSDWLYDHSLPHLGRTSAGLTTPHASGLNIVSPILLPQEFRSQEKSAPLADAPQPLRAPQMPNSESDNPDAEMQKLSPPTPSLPALAKHLPQRTYLAADALALATSPRSVSWRQKPAATDVLNHILGDSLSEDVLVIDEKDSWNPSPTTLAANTTVETFEIEDVAIEPRTDLLLANSSLYGFEGLNPQEPFVLLNSGFSPVPEPLSAVVLSAGFWILTRRRSRSV